MFANRRLFVNASLRIPLSRIILTAVLSSSGPVAAQSTASVNVTANVVPSCTLLSLPSFNFGNVISKAKIDRTGNIQLRCTKNTPYQVFISEGNLQLGDSGSRHLTRGDWARLGYQIYSQPTYAVADIWQRMQIQGYRHVAGVGTGQIQQLPVYARLHPDPAGLPPQGTYTDTLTVSIEY
ncbi:Csu type fimbrial protein [Sphingomonas fennica]|nr:spore coat U domain-containing protein [Sphingomonas fennica]